MPRILLVDDSPTQLILTELTLKKEGFEVVTAKNGVDGVNKAYSVKPDLIISDIIMPELNGYQLCRLLKNDRVTAGIPIILLTSLDQQLDRFWGIKAGTDRYLLKGSAKDLLVQEIRSLLSEAEAKAAQTQQAPEEQDRHAGESISSRVNYLLDKLLLESTISQEVLKLSDHIHDRGRLVQEFLALVSSLIDCSCLMVLTADRYEGQLTVDLRERVSREAIERRKRKLLIRTEFVSDERPIHYTCYNETLIDQADGIDFQSEIAVPLVIGKEFLGCLNLFSLRQRAFQSDIEENVRLLAKDFTMVVKLSVLYEENRRLSITDGLTKVYNHRYFQENLEKDFAAARRYERPLSLILLDIDHFKSFNDTYGHQQGDLVLSELAKVLRRETRKSDLVARYGGEEFAIVLPETDIESSAAAAEKLRQAVCDHPFPGQNQPLHVSISVGTSATGTDVQSSAQLIKMADNALYRAKQMGRNRVEVARKPELFDPN